MIGVFYDVLVGPAMEETTTEWLLRKLATSPFPIKTIRTMEKALNILTNTIPQNK